MYLNVVQLAESFGVEERIVENWVRDEGLPCVHDRGRMLFDRSQVLTWAAGRGLTARAGFLAPLPGVTHRSAFAIPDLLRHGGIWRDVAADKVLDVLERVVTALPGASPEVRRLLVQRLRAQGGVTWAPVGAGLALPHLRSPVALGRNSGILALVLLRDALTFDGPPVDSIPVTRLLFFIAPSPRAHLELLGQLSSALRRGDLRRLIVENAADADIFAALAAVESVANDSNGKGSRT